MKSGFPDLEYDGKHPRAYSGATSEFPQSVQTSFVPVTVFSWTSCTVFEWHFTQSRDTVSGLVINACNHLISVFRQSKI
jgi:hypothetical protein